MVFEKLKQVFNSNDDKYEALYHRFSHISLEHKKLQEKSKKDKVKLKKNLEFETAVDVIETYKVIEQAYLASHRITSTDRTIQETMLELNKANKYVRELLKKYHVEELVAKERFYDPEIHDVASYQEAKDMKKGLVLKTVKKGFKIRGELYQKPKVLVTK